tara:strand:- start:15 stop:296 length:282 start_codon:yes stop_codon:yes gene_type:complete
MSESKTPLIIVFYLARDMFSNPDMMTNYTESIKKYFDDNEDDVRLFFFPTDGDERLECINPVYFNEGEQKDKIDKLLELAEKQFDIQKDISNE